MRPKPSIPLSSVVFCILFANVLQATALSVKPAIWEQHVQKASFIGVVECEEDGFSLVKGRVLESWKGMKKGREIVIKVQMWEEVGEVFPVTKGERYLVAAYQIPLDLKAKAATGAWDYITPTYQGMNKLSRSKRGPYPGLGSPHPDLDTFKKAALDFLALSQDEQELRILKTQADQNINVKFWDYDKRKVDISEEVQLIQQRCRDAKTVETFVKELVFLKDCKPPGRTMAGLEALSVTVREGGENTLKALKSLSPSQGYQNIGLDIGTLESRMRYKKQQDASNSTAK